MTKLIVVESTLPPGTMKKYVIPLIDSLSKKRWVQISSSHFAPKEFRQVMHYRSLTRTTGLLEQTMIQLLVNSCSKNITIGKIDRTNTTAAEISKLAENS